MFEFEASVAEQVRLYRHLYDPSIRDHRDSQKVQNSWKEIGKTLGADEAVCKKVWKNVRDKFVKAKKKVRGKRGNPRGKKSPPILIELEWLCQYVKHRDTDFNMDVEEGEHSGPSLKELQTSCPGISESVPDAQGSSSSESPSTSNSTSEFISPSPSPMPSTTATPCVSPSPSPSLCSVCKRKRFSEDTLLKRFEQLDQDREMAKQQNLHERTFAAFATEMLSKLEEPKKSEVMLEIHKLLFEALRDSAKKS